MGSDVCIQCGKCAMVCPHSVIRIKVYDGEHLAAAPTFKECAARDREWQGLHYTIQVADCTGCGICVDVCPAKNKSATRFKAINMQPQAPCGSRSGTTGRFSWVSRSTTAGRSTPIRSGSSRCNSLVRVLWCLCGLWGDPVPQARVPALWGPRRGGECDGLLVHLWRQSAHDPVDDQCRRARSAWSNSLFEDNAEFGLGMRLALDAYAMALVAKQLAGSLDTALVEAISPPTSRMKPDIYEQRQRVARSRPPCNAWIPLKRDVSSVWPIRW